MTSGIITNISEQGAFVEYLDLNSAALINHIDFFKHIEVTVMANDEHYITQQMTGEIVRVEISGKQTSVAIKFNELITLAK